MACKKYGMSTAPQCFFCDSSATTRNKAGLEVCKKCIDNTEVRCPIDKSLMDIRDGKFGTFLFCWKCNRNWSKFNLIKYRKGGF